MENQEKLLLTCAEAADYVGLKETRLRYEVFLKRIPHIKVGRSIRFTRAQLEVWVEGNIVEGPNE